MGDLSCVCVSGTERVHIYLSLFSIVPHVPLLCCGERDQGGGNAGSALHGGKEGEEERRTGERQGDGFNPYV